MLTTKDFVNFSICPIFYGHRTKREDKLHKFVSDSIAAIAEFAIENSGILPDYKIVSNAWGQYASDFMRKETSKEYVQDKYQNSVSYLASFKKIYNMLYHKRKSILILGGREYIDYRINTRLFTGEIMFYYISYEEESKKYNKLIPVILSPIFNLNPTEPLIYFDVLTFVNKYVNFKIDKFHIIFYKINSVGNMSLIIQTKSIDKKILRATTKDINRYLNSMHNFNGYFPHTSNCDICPIKKRCDYAKQEVLFD